MVQVRSGFSREGFFIVIQEVEMLVVVSDNSFCKGLEDFFRSHEDYSIWHSFEWIDFRLKTGN